MKTLPLIAAFLISTATHAGCTVNFEPDRDGAFHSTIFKDKHFRKIVKIMEEKGYEVQTDRESRKTADYVLNVSGSYGYSCVTGLTTIDYLLMPSYFRVSLSLNHGNEIFERSDDYVRPVGMGAVAKARFMAFKAVREIPECRSLHSAVRQ